MMFQESILLFKDEIYNLTEQVQTGADGHSLNWPSAKRSYSNSKVHKITMQPNA